MDRLLRRLNVWLKKVRDIPFVGSMADDLIAMAQLLGDYAGGLYRDLPQGTVLALLVGICYLLLPVDLILDILPFAGFLDDAAILALILQLGLAQDLVRYRGWKTDLLIRQTKAIRDSQATRFREMVGNDRLAAAFLTENREIRLLICPESEQAPPLHCRSITEPIDMTLLERIDVTGWEDLGRFYTDLFQDPRFPWSSLGIRPFMPEFDPRAKSDDFIVTDT